MLLHPLQQCVLQHIASWLGILASGWERNVLTGRYPHYVAHPCQGASLRSKAKCRIVVCGVVITGGASRE